MKIGIASDHGGFEFKMNLIEALNDYEIIDLGPYNIERCDYPIYAKKVCKSLLDKTIDYGILICTTGVGMQICANRFKNIRAVLPNSLEMVKMSRLHNNCNVICFGAKYTTINDAVSFFKEFINSSFEGERHAKRILMIEEEI